MKIVIECEPKDIAGLMGVFIGMLMDKKEKSIPPAEWGREINTTGGMA